MIRTQISLTEEQMERLRREAARTGKSIAQLTREAIDKSLNDNKDERLRRLRLVAGSVKGDFGNLSENIDAEFVRAVESRGKPVAE